MITIIKIEMGRKPFPPSEIDPDWYNTEYLIFKDTDFLFGQYRITNAGVLSRDKIGIYTKDSVSKNQIEKWYSVIDANVKNIGFITTLDYARITIIQDDGKITIKNKYRKE